MTPPDAFTASQLVKQYSEYTSTHPVITEICDEDDFMTSIIDAALHHNKAVLDYRSTSGAASHLNVFDRAFLELARLENKKPAIALWLDEIIGIKVVPFEKQVETVRASCLTRARIITHITETSVAAVPTVEHDHNRNNGPEVSSDDSDHSASSDVRRSPAYSNPERPSSPNTRGSGCGSPNTDSLTRLISTFFSARDDFNNAPKKSIARTQAAKFLRDTIENCLTVLKSRPDIKPTIEQKAVVVEMDKLLSEMMAIAEKGCGGKKRPFEVREDRKASYDGAAKRAAKRPVVKIENSGSSPEFNILGRGGPDLPKNSRERPTERGSSPTLPRRPQDGYDDRNRSRYPEEEAYLPKRPNIEPRYAQAPSRPMYKNLSITPNRQPSGSRARSPAEYNYPSPWEHDAHVPRNANYTPLGGKKGGWNGISPFRGDTRRRFEGESRVRTREEESGGYGRDERRRRYEGENTTRESVRTDEKRGYGSREAYEEKDLFAGKEWGKDREEGEMVRGADTYRPKYEARGR